MDFVFLTKQNKQENDIFANKIHISVKSYKNPTTMVRLTRKKEKNKKRKREEKWGILKE